MLEQQLKAVNQGVGALEKMFEYAKENLAIGITEKQLAGKIRKCGRSLGIKEKWPFPFIVAFGPSAANPHHYPTKRKLGKKDIAKIDLGVKVGGYSTDCTRTFFVGRPALKEKNIYLSVLEAQKRGIRTIKDGVRAGLPDIKVREHFKKKRLGKHYIHSLGHGVSKSVHCYPYLRYNQARLLKTGEIVTVEPGIYIKGWGGIRIEDMVLVQQNGCRILTKKVPKNLKDVIVCL